jgi:predicted HTH transcriptional regulator
MKMSQLKMVIREVVREEIRLGLKEILGGVKRQPVQKPKPKQKQSFSKNTVLNEVLNDTDASDWETMGGGEYTSDRMNDIMGGAYKEQLDGDTSNINSDVIVDGQSPDFLKKDYRKLMKAVENKKR